ncbi:DUF5997 family protein, partial [Streptomyces violascens]|uniref:DUF5997 family protein n=1 Tax=Streptomyces violascens TaxID=67381 RepID=UPI0036C1EF24
VVASKLGFNIAGLARVCVSVALTRDQIYAQKQDNPEWLQKERATQAEVRKEAVRIKEKNKEKSAQQADEPRGPRS